MKYTTRIEVTEQITQVYDLFLAEQLQTINDRASYSLEKSDTVLTFVINAEDAVALRATLNAITKQLSVFEKMQTIE